MITRSSEILLRRKRLLLLDGEITQHIFDGESKVHMHKDKIAIGESQSAYLLCLMKNIEALGFTFSSEVVDNILGYLSAEDIGLLYKSILPVLKRLVGDDVIYKPMYKDFPESVKNTPEIELFINAIIHYITNGKWQPEGAYSAEQRLPLVEDTKLDVIRPGKISDITDIAKNILASKTSISKQDEEDLLTILHEYGIFINISAEDVKFKENIALIGKHILDTTDGKKDRSLIKLYPFFTTATDVLRLAVAMCDGDKSLAKNTKFTKFSRADRRIILGLLDNMLTCHPSTNDPQDLQFGPITVEKVPNPGKFYSVVADMNKHRQKWIRLAEVIHSAEYLRGPKEPYYYACMAIQIIRTNNVPDSFGHKVEKYYFTREFNKLVNTLSKRPGEFGRRLDSILREIYDLKDQKKVSEYTNKAIIEYSKVAKDISSTELLQILAHFKDRLEGREDDARVFFPKGNTQKYYLIKNEVTPIPVKTLVNVIKITESALKTVYSSRKSLGSVYISESMKNYVVPYAQRSASATSKPVTRGSKFPINENANVLRAFCWWTNQCDDEVSEERIKTWLEHHRGGYGYREVTRFAAIQDLKRVDIDLSCSVLNEDLNSIGKIWYGNLKGDSFSGYHSGDIVNGLEYDGEGVSEFIDVDIDSITKNGGRYVCFTVHSFTGQPFDALSHLKFGWMEREEANSGEIYEPKTVKMTMGITNSLTSCIPVLFDCYERKVIWADLPTGSIDRVNNWSNILTTESKTNYAVKAMLFSGKTDMHTLIKLNAEARGRVVTDREYADVIFEPDYETEENEPLDEKIKVYTPHDLDFYMGELL